ncbi:spore germination protein GerPE [Virgibacillus litoralis]|uniref:Spore germination protein PE n=1 Tax=Virgibacillus litoralis TaxID=578221 RepID=A0ABS4H8Q3_9BACI|nr:spore germination protein GerPE [Virgibacillus litoralis]MBP1947289.1 spore germination protein PE [Virgibacillus litoralis]
MQKRTASVRHIRVHGLTYSGIFNIGDTLNARPKSRGIAIQKEGATFVGDEGLHFNKFSLFQRDANWPTNATGVQKNTLNHSNVIKVGNISILGVSQSSILHIGNLNELSAEARVKHFRQYTTDTDNNMTS